MTRKKKFCTSPVGNICTGLYQSKSLDNAGDWQYFCDPLHKQVVPLLEVCGQGVQSGAKGCEQTAAQPDAHRTRERRKRACQVAARQAVVPVFLPFRGCPVRCVFCAQDVQTGIADARHPLRPEVPPAEFQAPPSPLPQPPIPQSPLPQTAADQPGAGIVAVLHEARHSLRQRHQCGLPPAELAFYGGTFTALPENELTACLDMASEALGQGLISSFRCSTRPDRVDARTLERLRAAGCGVVELGVQSFADSALAASRRGYTGATVLAACTCVREAGLKLGVQLLPGMPGHTPAHFAHDVPAALAVGADMLRFYPCLVLEGTGLAAMWRAGGYTPWALEPTLDALAHGWLAATRAGVPVIRMGLAPEQGLAEAILAGPVDRELGGRVKGRALLLAVREALQSPAAHQNFLPANGFALRLPRAMQGFFWGAGGDLRPAWEALGLRALAFEGGIEPQMLLMPSRA